MIRLDCQDACRGSEVRFGLYQRCGAVIGGYPDVFEDVSAQQETYVVREGIKCLPSLNQSGCYRQCVKAVVKVDRRASDGSAAQSRPKEQDVSLFINGDFLGE